MIRKKRLATVSKVAELDPGCYGKYSPAKEDCAKCKSLEWCREAKDPAQLTYENYDKALSVPEERESSFERFDDDLSERNYSQSQVCFVIHKLLTLEETTFRILKMKILTPTITDDQIGRSFGITRQAVSKQFKAFSEQFPQFLRLLSPRARIVTKQAEKCLLSANKNISECLKIINRGGN